MSKYDRRDSLRSDETSSCLDLRRPRYLTTDRPSSLRAALLGVALVQVIHVTREESFEEACRIAEAGVDALLLDSGDQRLAVKLLGGTGRTHDWSVSQRIVEAVSIPVFLAGGLTPENVADALRTVRPFGVDVCSSLRTGGLLDEAKLTAFFRAVGVA